MTTELKTPEWRPLSAGMGRPAIVSLLICAILGTAALPFSPVLAIAIALMGFLYALARALEFSLIVPRDVYGWLYALSLIATSLAPSLGFVGTVARFGLATSGLAIIVLLIFSGETPRVGKVVAVAAGTLLVSLLISSLGAASLAYGTVRLLNWLLFVPTAMLFLVRPRFASLYFGILIASTLQLAGMALQLGGYLSGTWGGIQTRGSNYDPTAGTWLIRYTGFALNPNDLGLLFCLTAIVSMLLITRVGYLKSLALLVVVTACAYGIVLTGSRGAILGFAFGVLATLLASGSRGIVALGAVAIATWLVSVSLRGDSSVLFRSLIDIASGSDTSLLARQDVWDTRLSDVSNVFLGSGFGNYLSAIAEGVGNSSISNAREAARQATVDNSWLKLYLETGLLGVTSATVLVVYALTRPLVRGATASRMIRVAVFVCFAVVVWRSTSVDLLDINPWNCYLWLGAAACLAVVDYNPAECGTAAHEARMPSGNDESTVVLDLHTKPTHRTASTNTSVKGSSSLSAAAPPWPAPIRNER